MHVAFAVLTLFRATSPLYELPCRPAVRLGAQQRALASGLAHHGVLGVLPVQAGVGRRGGVGCSLADRIQTQQCTLCS